MSEPKRLPVSVPSLADLQADQSALDRLPVDELLGLQRQLRHLAAAI